MLFSLLCVLLGVVFFSRRWAYRPRELRRIQDLDEALAILRESSLESRAEPNERLVRAFGIDNSFTTTSRERNSEFVSQSKQLLFTSDDDLRYLASTAASILAQRISQTTQNGLIPLVEMVHVLVFQISVYKFFPETPQPSEEDAITITEAINTVWLGSKHATIPPSQTQLQLQGLDIAIRRVFELDLDLASHIKPCSNPLNILLPAYEAAWQVVLSGFLELRFHSHHDNVSTLINCLENPSQNAFNNTNATADPSVCHIISETLRLYPPTKRIKRFQRGKLLDIDVEYLQRDVQTWGSDAECFKPERWFETSQRQMNAFMPFGSGRFVCPSKPWVGPALIGLLVAALVKEFDGYELVGEGGETVALDDGLLKSGREAYVQLGLRKTE